MNKRFPIFRKRWVLISGLVLLLIVLAYYGYRYNPRVNLSMCLNDPLKYDCHEISIETEAKVFERLPDGFILQEMGHTIRVKGDPQNVSPGDYVQLKAIFHKEGYLGLKHLYVAKGRRLKILVSIAPVVLVLFLLFRTYRFDWRQMLFRERV